MSPAPSVAHREAVARIALQRRARQQGLPGGRRERVEIQRRVDRAGIDRALGGKVSAEERGVDDDTANHTRQSEPDDAPVVPGLAAAARLPPVHPLSAVRVFLRAPFGGVLLEEIFLLREELVVGEERRSAQLLGCEVGKVGEREITHAGAPRRAGPWKTRPDDMRARPARAWPPPRRAAPGPRTA